MRWRRLQENHVNRTVISGATIVFDLDGTLVDTAPDLLGTVDRMLATIDLAPVPHGLIRPLISFGSKAMLARALEYHGRTLGDEAFHALWRRYLEDYEANIAERSRPFPGLIAALDHLQAVGATLSVCTNKNARASKALLTALGLADRFRVIGGRDTYPVMKPHPDHLLNVLRDSCGDAGRAVMIGDSDVDVATAKAARIPVVGVTFGYTPEPVHTYEPDAVIGHYDELVPALEVLFARK
jgi:phosphoglycolate phosphatase